MSPINSGLVILLSFLSEAEQRSLIISSLRDTTRHPNETNLDAHYNIPDTGLWTSWENRWHESRRGIQLEEEELIQPKASISSGNATTSPDPTPTRRTLVENIPASPSTLPVLQFLPKPPPTPSPYIKASPPSRLLFKLRWANIGRSYHWGTKSYDFDKKLAPFPEDVREYCKRAVKSIEWEDVWGTETEVDEKEWGEEGVNWRHWSDEYGL
jgi:alkylated DNA repair protein alkB family protein 1